MLGLQTTLMGQRTLGEEMAGNRRGSRKMDSACEAQTEVRRCVSANA